MKRSRSLGCVAGLLLLCALLVVGPNYMGMKGRSPASEGRTNLKGAHQALNNFFAELGNYNADFTTMGFIPERGNRFVYVFTGGPIQRRETASLPVGKWGIIGADQYKHPEIDTDALLAKLPPTLPSGVSPGIDSRGAVVVAIADLDRDGVPLIMSIATFDRTDAGVTRGSPFVEQED